jgi:hypothetical protein
MPPFRPHAASLVIGTADSPGTLRRRRSGVCLRTSARPAPRTLEDRDQRHRKRLSARQRSPHLGICSWQSRYSSRHSHGGRQGLTTIGGRSNGRRGTRGLIADCCGKSVRHPLTTARTHRPHMRRSICTAMLRLWIQGQSSHSPRDKARLAAGPAAERWRDESGFCWPHRSSPTAREEYAVSAFRRGGTTLEPEEFHLSAGRRSDERPRGVGRTGSAHPMIRRRRSE